jgi:type III secretion protein J
MNFAQRESEAPADACLAARPCAGRRNLFALVAVLALCACGRTPLYSELTETQANEVEAALLSAGIDAEKARVQKGSGWAVQVAKSEVPQAMAVLRAKGLPREQLDTLGEVFKKEGFVSSPLEERARYLHALSQELERTLMQLDGVVAARVHIALPEKDLLSDRPDSASASVVIIEEPGANLKERETDIKAIVTDGVEGLNDINRVTVKFFPRKALEPAAGAHTAAALLPSRDAIAPGLAIALIIGGGGAAWWWRLRRRDRPPSTPVRGTAG